MSRVGERVLPALVVPGSAAGRERRLGREVCASVHSASRRRPHSHLMSGDVLVTRDEAMAELARPLAEAAICSATFVALSVRTTVLKEDCDRAFRERERRGGSAAAATELRSAKHGSRLERSGSHDLEGHGPHRARDEQRYQAYRGWVSEQGIVEVGLATFRRKPVRRERRGGNGPLEKDPAAFDVQTFRYLFVRDAPEGSGALHGFMVTAPALRRLSRPDCGAQRATVEEDSDGTSSASDDADSLTSAEDDDDGISVSDAENGDRDGGRGETSPWGAAERDVLRFALRHGIRYAPPRPHFHSGPHSGRAHGHAGVSDQAEWASDRVAMRSVASDGNITTAANGRPGDWAPLPPSLAQGDGAILFRMLAEAHVPLIVYDGTYDIMSLYDAFHAPLPNTLSAFLLQLDRVLPRVVDVRYLATVPGMRGVGGVSGNAQPMPLRQLYRLAMAGAEFQCRHLLQSIRGGRLFVKHPAACALREQGRRKSGGGSSGSRAHQPVHRRLNTALETGETDPDPGSMAGILEAGINDLLSDASESREASQHGGFLFMPSAARGAGALRAADVKAAVGALGAALNGEAAVSTPAGTASADRLAVDARWNMTGAALRAFQVGAAFAHLFEKHGWAATVSCCQGRLPFGERDHAVLLLLPSKQRSLVRGAGANANSGIPTPRTASGSASAGLSLSTSPARRTSSELSSPSSPSSSSASPPAPEAAATRLTTAPGATSPRSLHDKAGSPPERPLAATMPLGFGPRATAGLHRLSGNSALAAVDDRLNRFLDIVAPNRLTEENREHVFQAMSAMVKRTLGAQTFVYGSFVGKTYLHPSDLNVGIFLVEGTPTRSSTAAGERGSGGEQISSDEASREPPCSTAWCATLMGALGLEAVRCAAGGGGGGVGGDRAGEAGIGEGGMAMPGMSLHADQVLAARRDALRRRRKRRGKHGGSSGSGGAADAAALPGAGTTEGITTRSATVAPSAAATTAAPSEGADSHQRAPLLESISNLSCSVSRDGGRPTAFVSCVADGYTVRLTLNPVEELCRARLYAEVDALIGREHLFLRSLQLLKAWSLYAPRGAASVPAVTVNGGASLSPLLPSPLLDTMALCLFNLFEATLSTPFQVLLRFFAFYGTELDWSRYGISVWGPVELATGALEPGAAGDAKPFLSEAFLQTFVDEYASCVEGAPRTDRNGASRDASAADGTSPSSPSPLPGVDGAAGAPSAAAVQRARQHAASCRHALNVFDVLDARQNVGASYLRHEDECAAAQEALRMACARCVALREQPTAEQLDALLGAERAVDDALETVREHLGDVLSDTLRGAYAAPAFPTLPSRAGGDAGGGSERRKAVDGGRSLVYEEHEEVDGGAAEPGAHRLSSRPLEYLMQSGLLHADPNRCFAGQSAPLMVPDTVQLKHNFEYVRFLVHSHVSEIGLLAFLTQTLVTRKTLLIGEIGQALRATFGGQDWSAILKERFGGLKRFLERHSELFWIDTDHPLNPHIYLRSRPNGPPILPEGREWLRRPAEEVRAGDKAPTVEVANEREVTERKSNRNVGGTTAEKARNDRGAPSWQTSPTAGMSAAEESGTVAPVYPPPPPPLESVYYGPTNGYGAYAPPVPYMGAYPYANTRSMRPLYPGMPQPPPYYEAPPRPPMPAMHPSPPRWEHPPPTSPGRSARLVHERGAGGERSGAPMRTGSWHRPI